MTKDIQEKLKDLAAVLAAITALVATIKELREALQGAGTEVWKNWPWYVIPAVIFLGLLLWRRDRLVRWLVPRSTVSKREAFHIGRKFLLGREGDIGRLLHVLAEWPLVFLVGESGAGKSSLLERGILPRLEKIQGQIPILINSWGPDWIEGPREALARALEPLLDEPLRKLLGLEGPVAPGKAVEILGRLRTEAFRTPVLLFDQLDDYQTRHRDKFLSGPGRTLLTAEELATQNPFWGEIASLLKTGGVRCLFTTRSDAKIGLESVRFQEPKTYPLDPLDKSAAADLLAEVSKEAVDHPERSFERLRERLLDDLAADGWVLPIQMQVAFSGLADLRFLSVSEYERQGGLPGLEALYLETRISAAARAVGASIAEVRAVLLAMVDRATRKTVPQPTDRLLKEVPGWAASKLQDLLEKLEVDEVVRRRIDPGGEGSVWLLDHDYLSRGLLELDRRARRWTLFLGEAARSYQAARGLDRWKKLLSPTVQLRLLYERLRGRLIYGEHAGYARLSTVRLLVWLVWVAVPLLALYGWRLFDQQRTAGQLFAEFGQDYMTTGELRALWKLASVKPGVHRSFLDATFSEPSANAQRLLQREDSVLHAIVGFRSQERLSVLDRIFRRHCLRGTPEPATIAACTGIVQRLGAPPADLEQFMRLRIQMASSLGELVEIQDNISALPGFIDQELPKLISRKAFDAIALDQGRTPSDVSYINTIHLEESERRKIPGLCIKSLKSGEDERWCWLIKSKDDLLPSEKKELIDIAHRELEGGSAVGQLIRILSTELPLQDAEKAVMLLTRMNIFRRASILANSRLLQVLKSEEAKRFLMDAGSRFRGPESGLIKRLSSEDALEVWQFDLVRGSQSYDIAPMSFLVDRLSLAGAAAARGKALAGLRDATSLDKASYYLKVLGTLKISEDQAVKAVSLFTIRLDAASESQRRLNLGSLGSIPLRTSAAEPLARRILTELAKPEDDATKPLIEGLLSFTEDLPESDAREVINLAKRRLETTLAVSEWLSLLNRLRPRLTGQDEMDLAAELLKRQDILEPVNLASFQEAELHAAPELLEHTLTSWLKQNHSAAGPDCGAVVPLIQDPKDSRILDLLKWPTCSPEGREIIIHRLDDLLPNASFGTKDANGEYHADIWGKFVPWAKKQGLDLESPPKLPDLDKLKVEEVEDLDA